MRFRQALLTVDNQQYSLRPNERNAFGHFYADFQQALQPAALASEDTATYRIAIHPKQDIIVQHLEVQFDLQIAAAERFFCNGYQSWTESQLLHPDQSLPRVHWLARTRMGKYGDDEVAGIPRAEGYLHSWTYTYVQDYPQSGQSGHLPDHIKFVGSLNESTGFTLLLYDWHNSILTIRKDLDALTLGHSWEALDFWVASGAQAKVFDAYFGAMRVQPPATPPAAGWTSWYHHFTNISETLLLENADTVAASDEDFTYFQIDDGWKTNIGDWLSVKPEFPHGMAYLAAEIRAKGFKPGLWLSPFIAGKNSKLYKNHPAWLLKDKKGKPLRAGWNPMWGGWYYALDFYNPQVREYLAGVFHVVCEQWNYELFKLDFLFAVALNPPPDKTRGAVMHEAMVFLRELIGPHRKILGCGVPLGSCFGLTEFCRIGGDVHMKWDHWLLTCLNHRERVSTIASLRSTLGRWHLNGRAFHSDPDVFILRTEKQQLTPTQQYTLLIINALLGNLLFTSDDLRQYTPAQSARLTEGFSWRNSTVHAVTELQDDLWHIYFHHHSQPFHAFCNLNKTEQRTAHGTQTIALAGYETVILED